MGGFIKDLLSGNEGGVNSVITCGVGGAALHFLISIGVTVAMLIHDPSALFNGYGGFVTAFVGGLSGIIAFISGGKTLHDRVLGVSKTDGQPG